jgi:chain length determinant protein tyrosine kinase EpsG
MTILLRGPGPRAGHTPESAQDASSRILDRSIGDFLRESCSLSNEQVEKILQHQRERGMRFGEAAVELGLASSEDVLWALSQQFHYPYASDDAAPFDEELVAAIDPFGEQAEAFREMRSQLMADVLAADQPRRALAVLSPDSGDGKTFFAANMAIAFSQLGGRTLLVDADMRTPRQHCLFRVPNELGLSSILAGRTQSNAIYQVPQLPSLRVLPVGTVPPNPLELAQRPAFGLFMRELLAKFDHVIVDTPAAAHGADARVLAAKCGAAVVIGRRGNTRMKAIQTLLGALGNSSTRLAGVMVNNF